MHACCEAKLNDNIVSKDGITGELEGETVPHDSNW